MEPQDEMLAGAEAMARDLAGGREPTATEVRRVRHWIAKRMIRTRKMGELHVTTRRHLRADVEPFVKGEAACVAIDLSDR